MMSVAELVTESQYICAGFSGTIVPGILLASLFPAIIGSAIPGAIYASQSVKFRSPALVSPDAYSH